MQKAGLALLDAAGDAQSRTRDKLRRFFLFAPVFFVVVLIVGGLIDYIVNMTLGEYTVASALIGLAFYLLAAIYTLFTVTTEKKAGAAALTALGGAGFMTREELDAFRKLQRHYMIKYVLDFIVTLLRLLLCVLELIAKSWRHR